MALIESGLVDSLIEGPHSSSSEEDNNNLSVTSTLDATLNSEIEDENDLLFPLIQLLLRGQRRHRVEDYLSTIHKWTDDEFREHLRFKRPEAYALIDELQASGYIPHHTFGMTKISAELSFLIFLWYIGNTEPLRTLSDRFDVSISSIFRILRRIVSWLLTRIDDVIKWPSEDDIFDKINGFKQKQGIDNCIGAIDGCHIRIQKPSESSEVYCNRKKFFSIILQAVVDVNMKFTNIYCGEPGSLHDARVLRRSVLHHSTANNLETIFPHNTFIIGDSAYPNLEWLVPPFRNNGHLTPQQIEFNYRHSSTRMVVERTFGHLKGRFRRIKFFNEYRDIQFITEMVTAICILHNISLDEGEHYELENDYFIEDLIDEDYDELLNININRDNRRNIVFREMFN
ncbi:putative nuclease HARBI1 [Prorops nasuta]|uniref:putative nuclease HARBI1 n=1 Tax=Prorops nasuta TaxID=863751 RepID=UPI0034D006B0